MSNDTEIRRLLHLRKIARRLVAKAAPGSYLRKRLGKVRYLLRQARAAR